TLCSANCWAAVVSGAAVPIVATSEPLRVRIVETRVDMSQPPVLAWCHVVVATSHSAGYASVYRSMADPSTAAQGSWVTQPPCPSGSVMGMTLGRGRSKHQGLP